jgi:hypothetical protein
MLGSQKELGELIAKGSRLGLKTFDAMMRDERTGESCLALIRAIDNDLSNLAKVWQPGLPVTENTWVSGKDFKEFYFNGWDMNWYHDDYELECESCEGEWMLDDDGIYPLYKLGHSVWQGPEDQARKGEMQPVHIQFAEWAKKQSKS